MAVTPRRKAPAVATFATCRDVGRAHSFPLTSSDEFCLEATMDLLERAGGKLGFRPADLMAWTAEDMKSTPTGPGDCACGLAPQQVDCLQGLRFHLADMVKAQRRKTAPILLHVQGAGSGSLEGDLLTSALEVYRAPGAASQNRPGPLTRVQKLQKQSPGDLRLQAQHLWAHLEEAKVYIPPLDAEKSGDKFHLERHGHGRGNTKSTKKRRKRQDRHDLCRLILHLEQLALDNGLQVAAPPTPKETPGDSSEGTSDA